MNERVIFQEKFSTRVLEQELPKVFNENDSVALKLHMGEAGNRHFLKPELVKPIVSCMKALGLKPFLLDSPVMYHSARHTSEGYLKVAAAHGYSEQTMGCPVLISDDYVEVKTHHLTVEVCRPLDEADGMLVLSHVKGHACSGFGGAIKNLGMGAVSKKTKADIHQGGSPVFGKEEGCTGCATCRKYCPAGAIAVGRKAKFDYSACWGCNLCVTYCPQKTLGFKLASFDRLLSEAASAVVHRVKKVYYVNALIDIAKYCDCVGSPRNPIVAEDLGFLFSADIVAIDKASMDLLNEKAGHDLFLEINHKSPEEHIREAAALGMGSLDYSLEGEGHVSIG